MINNDHQCYNFGSFLIFSLWKKWKLEEIGIMNARVHEEEEEQCEQEAAVVMTGDIL